MDHTLVDQKIFLALDLWKKFFCYTVYKEGKEKSADTSAERFFVKKGSELPFENKRKIERGSARFFHLCSSQMGRVSVIE